MSQQLEQAGIFKVRPITWDVRKADSGAVALSFSFLVLAELENGTWEAWDSFGEYHVYGDWWIVKKDGSVNVAAVEQLRASIGWDGSLVSVDGQPQVTVQVKVKADTYKDVTRYKATWMNPEDFEGAGGAPGALDTNEKRALEGRFGSLLRAAAAGAASAKSGAKQTQATGPKRPEPQRPLQPPTRTPATVTDPISDEPIQGDDIPF